MKQTDPKPPDAKMKVGDLVRVNDVNSPFYRWEMSVEKVEWKRHSSTATGKLVELESWFYTCSHQFLLVKPNDVTLKLFFREDQLDEVFF